jgi:beta-barrel assembly-enhancing protease
LQSYSAILIHPNVPGGRCSGNLHLNASHIDFKSDEIHYQIPVSNLSVNAGGASNRFIFLRDKNESNISVYTSDKSILKHPVLSSNKELSIQLANAKKSLNATVLATLTLLFLILMVIGGLYLMKDKMVESLSDQVPPSWEKATGDKLFTALSLQYKFINNDSLKKEFLHVGSPLFRQVEKQGYPIDLYFVKDPSINAFALPGGKVVIQSGLIENAKSWEEVMGVVGHELAHVTRRHHIRGVINNIGIYTLLAAFVGDVSALAGTFVNFGGDLASLANSRSFENEADETGWDYLVKAQINPAGLISFFETLEKENQTKLDSTLDNSIDLSFLSTHPDIDERIEHLKKRQKSTNTTFKPLPGNFGAFRKRLLDAK